MFAKFIKNFRLKTTSEVEQKHTKEQPASGLLPALKDRVSDLNTKMINLQRVRNTELEQGIDLLNNLIELYSKKKP